MSETTDAGPNARNDSNEPPADKYGHLTAFQRDLLHVLNQRGPSKGLALKDYLEGYCYDVVHHGRLYPNLNDLVEEGLVSKSERDKRTNEYALTDAGEQALAARKAWTTSCTEAGA
ncbi:DNA-binding PadR family transcriptional regulator [Halarchaeum rubridurum]|uniref:PadR family transcriptional regulator n=1 Tax=Halarchaeum rubridurum TaxID=489911 RepID=A0A830G0E7_9EURY|nr:PadR family transcriptional regulator [Halarchaeum rubridurum]MBP1955067.1 DNA-binding PadR family transcriptional regulator [Halarchaeum rubridurum]GGM69227.1 PadR family transcriptional regulator [Halarchaeum rubridurum]